MGRFFRILLLGFFLVILASAAFIAVSDVPAPTKQVVQEVPNGVLFPQN